MAEDSLARWWLCVHGVQVQKTMRFHLAREHTLRGLPRIRRGSGAGELLEDPVSSAHLPIGMRGVSNAWLLAFVVWLHVHRLFKLPVRVFAECFGALLTTPHECALYDFIPEAHRCAPHTFTCHSWDDDLYAVLAANQDAPWLSLFAQHVPPHDHVQEPHTRLAAQVEQVLDCVAACSAGLVVCLPGKGEPCSALRPLTRGWCLLELCCALERYDAAAATNTDPYDATVRSPTVRFAVGGIDDDVERHREIAEALCQLSFDASTAQDPREAEVLRRVLNEGYGAIAEARLREATRHAFAQYYSRPQHVHIRELYCTSIRRASLDP